MIYDAKKEKKLSPELFMNPTSDFRGAPFWAWNCKLDIETLKEQIDVMRDMGMGGAHMHVRTGMATTYLSEEHMNLIKECVEKFKSNNMLAWLYDEDRWPSGAAGGYVTKDPKYRARYLLITPRSYADDKSSYGETDSSARAVRSGNGKFVACYDVKLDAEGYLASYKRIGEDDEAEGVKWYAYMETPNPNPWYNNQTYVNMLDKAAIDKFIEITYEAYYKKVGDEFGKAIPSIFTDEPQFSHKTTLDFAHDLTDITLPWTDDLPESFEKAYGDSLLDKLPEVVWELPASAPSVTRYHYHDHVAERFAEAFADNCGKWCREHNLMLTGHMMEEPTLESQTAALGEAMRSYRSFGLVGVDMLCDRYEFTTVKQTASAAHQYGYPGVLSELYGVTNWDFDFRGHKTQGDWQAALGVTTRVPHLAWVSMQGEAKRDYPASINYQAPWHEKYSYVENHFARAATALTRGKPDVKVGVIHPIESYWLHWGPGEHTRLLRNQLDENFDNFIKWMLLGTVDFDYICESLLPSQSKKSGAPFNVGNMDYDIVIVPSCETLRSSTLERLEAFKEAGGKLIFAGNIPTLENAVLSERAVALAARSEVIAFEKKAILEALADVRDVEIRGKNGSLTENLLYQMRDDNTCKWLFIAHGVRPENKDLATPQKVRIRIRGEYDVSLYETLDGSIKKIAYEVANGYTYINDILYDEDSRLFCLEEGGKGLVVEEKTAGEAKQLKLPKKLEYKLDEQNVFTLDSAEYSFDGGAFAPEEEILRIDNNFRELLGWPSRELAVAQPWVIPDEPYEHTLTLRFKIESDIEVSKPILAIEDAERLSIALNGEKVANDIIGYFTDKAIKKVALPPLVAGTNILTVDIPFNKRADVEYAFVLGDFGVDLRGLCKKIIKTPEFVAFGNLTYQGFPFYGSNLTYEAEIETGAGKLKLHIPQYRGALLSVMLDGEEKGNIVYAPYDLEIGGISAGKHTLGIKMWGSRVNTFGPIHLADEKRNWIGPDAYRTTGDAWSYEYDLKPTGVLSSPVITFTEE